MPPHKIATFYLHTPSSELSVEVYVVAGTDPFAVVYDNESSDFTPLAGGNLTFTNVGVEGTINRTGTYTMEAVTVVPLVLRDANHTYTMATDPPLTMSLYEVTALNPVTFVESGLPFGVEWWVDLNGDNQSSTYIGIGFSKPDGNYTYITGASGYTASPSSGAVTVNGGYVYEPITFATSASTLVFVVDPFVLTVIIVVIALVLVDVVLAIRYRRRKV
jgi:hypothetical protein